MYVVYNIIILYAYNVHVCMLCIILSYCMLIMYMYVCCMYLQVEECLNFCHDNVSQIVASPCNMGCINERLLAR